MCISMARRIDAVTDMNILRDLGLGMTNKAIAEKYKVSASYVSKIKTGRKVINIYVPEPKTTQADGLEIYKEPLDSLIEMVLALPVFKENDDIIAWVKKERIRAALRVKMLTEILNKMKGE